jgi:hypothetical protein
MTSRITLLGAKPGGEGRRIGSKGIAGQRLWPKEFPLHRPERSVDAMTAEVRHERLSLRSRRLDVRGERPPAPCGQGLSQRQADDGERHHRRAHLFNGVDLRARVRRQRRRGAATRGRRPYQPEGDRRLVSHGAQGVDQPAMTFESAGSLLAGGGPSNNNCARRARGFSPQAHLILAPRVAEITQTRRYSLDIPLERERHQAGRNADRRRKACDDKRGATPTLSSAPGACIRIGNGAWRHVRSRSRDPGSPDWGRSAAFRMARASS